MTAPEGGQVDVDDHLAPDPTRAVAAVVAAAFAARGVVGGGAVEGEIDERVGCVGLQPLALAVLASSAEHPLEFGIEACLEQRPLLRGEGELAPEHAVDLVGAGAQATSSVLTGSPSRLIGLGGGADPAALLLAGVKARVLGDLYEL